MAQLKRNSDEMRLKIGLMLTDIYMDIGIDDPQGNDTIIEFVMQDVSDAAGVVDDDVTFTMEDVRIAFRRLLEKAAEDLIPE